MLLNKTIKYIQKLLAFKEDLLFTLLPFPDTC